MIDIDKQVGFWRDGSEEDFAVAGELIRRPTPAETQDYLIQAEGILQWLSSRL